jgi:hypothetical protein
VIFANRGRDHEDGGDGPDRLWALSRFDVEFIGDPNGDELSGGNGNDRFRVRDGEVDLVHCGEGTDHVKADQFDQVDNDCEHVDRGDVTVARPGGRRGREPGRARGLTTTVGAGTVARPCQPTTSSRTSASRPSILASDFARLGEQVESSWTPGARVIHVDVMDGHFVPPISIGSLIVDALRDLVHGRGGMLDVHLMVERPERRIQDFAGGGRRFDRRPLGGHAARELRAPGGARRRAERGLALNPATPPTSWRAWPATSTTCSA